MRMLLIGGIIFLVCAHSSAALCGTSKLVSKQQEFTRCKGVLITYAFERGWALTDGDAFRNEKLHGKFGETKGYGSPNSVHKLRLAQDFNLYVGGELIKISEHPAWGDLHKFWQSLGGAKAIPGDAGHFSFQYGRYR